MNEFAFYIIGLLGMISAACALWLAIELKRTEKELEEAEERWLYLSDLAERIEAQKKG